MVGRFGGESAELARIVGKIVREPVGPRNTQWAALTLADLLMVAKKNKKQKDAKFTQTMCAYKNTL